MEIGFIDVLPNFVSVDMAEEMRLEFLKFYSDADSDDLVPNNSHAVYNPRAAVELMCNSNFLVTEYLGENVVPTFAYGRLYKKGSELKRHADRGAAEIVISVNLGSDKPYPIYFEDMIGQVREINLNQGDAVIYHGKELIHWRDPFDGDECIQYMLCYVRTAGHEVHQTFDRFYRSVQMTDVEYEQEENALNAL